MAVSKNQGPEYNPPNGRTPQSIREPTNRAPNTNSNIHVVCDFLARRLQHLERRSYRLRTTAALAALFQSGVVQEGGQESCVKQVSPRGSRYESRFHQPEPWFLERINPNFQSTQNDCINPKMKGLWAMMLGTFKAQVLRLYQTPQTRLNIDLVTLLPTLPALNLEP